jgi:hypothetical protein
MNMSVEEKKSVGTYLRSYVMNNHSLTVLVSRLMTVIREAVVTRK